MTKVLEVKVTNCIEDQAKIYKLTEFLLKIKSENVSIFPLILLLKKVLFSCIETRALDVTFWVKEERAYWLFIDFVYVCIFFFVL